MLVDLIIIVIRMIARASTKSAPKLAAQRKVKSGDIVLHCPACDAVGIAASYNLETQRNGNWIPQTEVFECASCGRTHNAALFKNDGTGVMVVNTWPCPTCGRPILATSGACSNCG